MKHKALAFCLACAAATSLVLTTPASAQISDDVIRIGFITDISGPYGDIDGIGGVEAIRMAISDMGGSVNGKRIELLYADHQNKPDIANTKAREWFDQQKIDLLVGGQNSATNLSMARVAAEKKKPFIAVGSSVTQLTNEECTPYTVHYVWDNASLAKGPGKAIVQEGGKTWYFLTVDYAFGQGLEADTTKVVTAAGGTVLGSARHPLNTADFSSFLIQAQASKAQVLAIANAGGDTINAIKTAREFGITKNMRLVSLVQTIMDTHSLGLEVAKNLYLTDPWYWDLTPESRVWARRYFEKMKKMPTSMHAGDYSAVTQYLQAVKAIGSDDGDKVMGQLKKVKINDMFAKNAYIRADGRMMHDMYLMQVKTPAESKYPWDYYKLVRTIPAEEAFMTKAESKCKLWQ
jgi:branched-chain amino acid transport system substrate-binding protein